MIRAGQAPSKSKVVIMGITFKENCPDIRNSKVEDIINRLKEYDITPVVIDPWADVDEVMREYGVELAEAGEISDADCVIIAVAHNEFKGMPLSEIDKIFEDTENKNKVLVDVKSMIDKRGAGCRVQILEALTQMGGSGTKKALKKIKNIFVYLYYLAYYYVACVIGIAARAYKKI